MAKDGRKVGVALLFGVATWATGCGTQPSSHPQSSLSCPVGAVLGSQEPATEFLIRTNHRVSAMSESHGGEEHLKTDLSRLGVRGQVERVGVGLYRAKFDQPIQAEVVASQFHDEDFSYIEPDSRVHSVFSSNDPGLPSQWAHQVVGSAAAWDISRGNRSVVVGVIDSGIDINHSDLTANIWNNSKESANGLDDDANGLVDDLHGWNFADGNSNVIANDYPSYHGTHVAGTIGAVGNNGVGVSGEAQTVALMALKFLGSDGSGSVSSAVSAIDYAIAHQAKILSNSWGSATRSQALFDAIERARQAGILFVAAAGNGGSDGVGDNNDTSAFYPAGYSLDNIISVAASTSSDALASFSNYGMSVHLAAPGVNIYSTKNGNTYQYMSGTSMAAPLISGVLATMISMRGDLDYQQIRSALLGSVDQVPSMAAKIASGGRVNAYHALHSIQSGAPPAWVAPNVPSAPQIGCP